jgi:hypothetical protein
MSYSFVNGPAVRTDIIEAIDYYKKINPEYPKQFLFRIREAKDQEPKCRTPNAEFQISKEQKASCQKPDARSKKYRTPNAEFRISKEQKLWTMDYGPTSYSYPVKSKV